MNFLFSENLDPLKATFYNNLILRTTNNHQLSLVFAPTTLHFRSGLAFKTSIPFHLYIFPIVCTQTAKRCLRHASQYVIERIICGSNKVKTMVDNLRFAARKNATDEFQIAGFSARRFTVVFAQKSNVRGIADFTLIEQLFDLFHRF